MEIEQLRKQAVNMEKRNEDVLKKSLYKKWQEKEIIRLQYGWMRKN